MTFLPGRFYRYRRVFGAAIKSQLKTGDVYEFTQQKEHFSAHTYDFCFKNALGEEFDLSVSYDTLDSFRLEEAFDEIPKPTWWDEPRQPFGD